jgi:CRISPR-associated protein Cmr2
VTDPTWWLSFSLTPVQRFIEAARTVRDLKTGSALLSYLVGRAYAACRACQGTPLFPILKNPNQAENIPNQFIMSFDDEPSALQAATDAQTAVRDEWRTMSQGVRSLLKPWDVHGDWAADWDRQIESYWDVRALLLRPSDVTAPVLNALFGLDETEAATELSAPEGRLKFRWLLLASALNASKQVRHFPGDGGMDREKCTMLGDLEQMGPGGSVEDQADFWRKGVSGFTRRTVRIGPTDRLCAVSLVKRFAPAYPQSPLGSLAETVPDTAAVALADWRQQFIADPVLGPQLHQLDAAVRDFRQLLDHRAAGNTGAPTGEYKKKGDLSARVILDQGIRSKKEREEYPKLSPNDWNDLDPLIGQVEHFFHQLQDARRNLPPDQKNPGPPPRYFAILEMDGDHIGKRLSGEYGYGPHPESFHRDLSEALRTSAGSVPGVVEEHLGYPVYAGGDDLLALLPMRNAFRCAARLRHDYDDPPLPPETAKATASAGLVLCHYKENLRDALDEARKAIDAAKTFGRDACGVTLLKRSGAPLKVVLSWDLIEKVGNFTERFAKGDSDRWAYRLGRLLDAVPTDHVFADPSDRQIEMMIRHFVRRAGQEKPQEPQDDAASGPSSMETEAVELWALIDTFLHDRHAQLRNASFDPAISIETHPLRDETGFLRMALATYLDSLGIATFLARRSE